METLERVVFNKIISFIAIIITKNFISKISACEIISIIRMKAKLTTLLVWKEKKLLTIKIKKRRTG